MTESFESLNMESDMDFCFVNMSEVEEAAPVSYRKEASLIINGTNYKIDGDLPVSTSLNSFIRNNAKLTGTKYMCQEGGCGSCIVTVWHKDPATKQDVPLAVNSCLFPVLACDGKAVTTIEGIGSKLKGYHRLQTSVMENNASQCGYCTPGMIMNMYSLLENGPVTTEQVENSFGGNICRCTGYMPILKAFRSLTVDASDDLKKRCIDIEELGKIKICDKTRRPCSQSCDSRPSLLNFHSADGQWVSVSSIKEIQNVFKQIGDKTYILLSGDTAKGVYHRFNEPQVFININGVKELKSYSAENQLTIGANMSLTNVMELFRKLAQEQPKKFAYTKVLADHLDLVANIPVRNVGTIAGNLSIKHDHHEFPSDVFLIFEAVGATVTIVDTFNKEEELSLPNYLKTNMKKKVLKNIKLPSLDGSYRVQTYKIMPRAQNAHAYVNAGFRFKMSSDKKTITQATIVYGGINPSFIHANATENFLRNKGILDLTALKGAMIALDSELKPDHVLPDSSPQFRKGLAKALLYKFFLSMSPDSVQPTVQSGGTLLQRPVSSTTVNFDTDKSQWPLNQPIPKIEGLVQASGEAQYVNDIPHFPDELFGALVLTTVGQGKISKIDASAAMKQKGVVSFLKAEDIPGKNSFTANLNRIFEDEELFCSGKVRYAGQPIGVILAENPELANKAAKLVRVEYEEVKKPLITIDEVLASGDKSRIRDERKLDPTDPGAKSQTKYTIKGKFNIGSQYHFHMEPQTCLCVPIEDGLDIYPSSQWMDLIQVASANALGIPENSINVKVRRLGGGYGAKISRSGIVGVSCALAAHKLNRPVRMVMSIQDNMNACGKRFFDTIHYEVGVDENGVIKYMNSTLYENKGAYINETFVADAVDSFMNCYDPSTWSVDAKLVVTDLPSNSLCRAPGSTEGIAFIENIMEHIAKTVDKDPMEVRINNFKKDSPIFELTDEIRASSSYDERVLAVEEFNKENKWKKRGIAFVAMEFPLPFFGNFYSFVSIYAGDGSVAVSHGGIECGQGINTKVLQVCAYTLGIPMELVSVKPSNTLTAPNNMVTGGSIASESCCYATWMACKELLQRLEPIRKEMVNPTWQELIARAYNENIDLCAKYMFTTNDDVKNYSIYGVTVTEVELDILTGQHQILRVDLIEDCGQSLSPQIDLGQIEGAFVFGLGFYLSEQLIYHPETGELLTNRTWNYKPPGVKDIPIDFRIQFRRNAPNPFGVLRSKATGEPPLCMSFSVICAVRNALNSARSDAGRDEKWYNFDTPATAENIFLTGLASEERYVY